MLVVNSPFKDSIDAQIAAYLQRRLPLRQSRGCRAGRMHLQGAEVRQPHDDEISKPAPK